MVLNQRFGRDPLLKHRTRRKLLIASLAISGVMLVANLVTLATTPFDWVYLVELSLPVMLLAAGIGVLRIGPENQPPRLSR